MGSWIPWVVEALGVVKELNDEYILKGEMMSLLRSWILETS